MKSSAKAKANNAEITFENRASSDPFLPTSAGAPQIKSAAPSYEKMYAAIEKVSDPVSFESLKEFYGMSEKF